MLRTLTLGPQRLFLLVLLFSLTVLGHAQSALDLFNQAVETEQSGNLINALDQYMLAYEAFGQEEGHRRGAKDAECLHNMARVCANLNMIEQSRTFSEMALDIRKKCFGEVSEPYITTLHNYANTFFFTDLSQALELNKKVIELMEKMPQPHSLAWWFYKDLGICYYHSGDWENSVVYLEKSLACAEKYSDDYVWLLNNLGQIYYDLGRKDDFSRILALTEENNKHELDKNKDCNEPQCLLDNAMYYISIEDNENAQECFNTLRLMSLDDPMKVKVYRQYGAYVQNSDPVAAAESFKTAADALVKIEGISFDYGILLGQIATCYELAEEYELAIGEFTEAIDVFNSLNLAGMSNALKEAAISCMNDLAFCYGRLGFKNDKDQDHSLAVKYAQDVVDYYSCSPQSQNQLAKATEELAKYQMYAEEFDPAIENFKKAIEIYQVIGDVSGAGSAFSELTICYKLAGLGNQIEQNPDKQLYYEEQIRLLDELLSSEIADLGITREFLSRADYASSLGLISQAFAQKGDNLMNLREWKTGEDFDNCYKEASDNYAKSVEYYGLFLPALREALRDEFRLSSEKERMQIWENEKPTFQELEEFLILLPTENKHLLSELSGVLYDAVLLSKGILLNSSIEFEDIINSSDPHLKDIYQQTKDNEQLLSILRMNMSEDPTEKELQEIVELQTKNDVLQLELMRGCSEYADFTNYISYSWGDVQNRLSEEDVAIEFAVIDSDLFEEDSFLAALVLTKDMEMPKILNISDLETAQMIELCATKDDADALLYSNPAVGEQIWGQMKPYFDGKKKVYFSTEGPFNRIAIEYLLWDGKPLSEQFDMYRLSSTKELCRDRKLKPLKNLTNMALIGNINYFKEGVLDNKTQRNLNKVRQAGGDLVFDELDGTKKEIDGIAAIMKKDKKRVIVSLEGDRASEKAFRELSGSNVDLLHIATHGAYIDKGDQSDAEAMQNSLLAFAGANRGDEDETNDGLVTAEDIAKMNLRNCDLVVLSACESGLGKLSDDGVFGLQRGFKNAGVHQLMMSLRNVYDVATAEMMTAFYRNLSNGSTAREALTAAQTELRSKGYTDAKYWAPFILLDAIE